MLVKFIPIIKHTHLYSICFLFDTITHIDVYICDANGLYHEIYIIKYDEDQIKLHKFISEFCNKYLSIIMVNVLVKDYMIDFTSETFTFKLCVKLLPSNIFTDIKLMLLKDRCSNYHSIKILSYLNDIQENNKNKIILLKNIYNIKILSIDEHELTRKLFNLLMQQFIDEYNYNEQICDTIRNFNDEINTEFTKPEKLYKLNDKFIKESKKILEIRYLLNNLEDCNKIIIIESAKINLNKIFISNNELFNQINNIYCKQIQDINNLNSSFEPLNKIIIKFMNNELM